MILNNLPKTTVPDLGMHVNNTGAGWQQQRRSRVVIIAMMEDTGDQSADQNKQGDSWYSWQRLCGEGEPLIVMTMRWSGVDTKQQWRQQKRSGITTEG